MSRYVRKRRDLVEAARTVFADAGDEFGSLRALKARPAHCLIPMFSTSEAVTWFLQCVHRKPREVTVGFVCGEHACAESGMLAFPTAPTQRTEGQAD